MEHIIIIGLGYVGLPLAAALSPHHQVLGFDIKAERISELRSGLDQTNELSTQELQLAFNQGLELEHDFASLQQKLEKLDYNSSRIFIVTVPTPINQYFKPDLTILERASQTVGQLLKAGDIVVYESTVYPGVTEGVCRQVLEQYSNLTAGQDFHLGYSPERVNPGDKQHKVTNITKVVAANDLVIANRLADMYGSMNQGKIFIAADIKTAEAAKVIENTQRDINIAFINELTQIFNKAGISIQNVLAAAGSKWNFLNFQPGLVGGHCIGIDPYYLAHFAQELGHHPQIILAGREINEAMANVFSAWIQQKLSAYLAANSLTKAKILILGCTFKENVPDIRNTKVVELINNLLAYGHEVVIHDPLACPNEFWAEYKLKVESSLLSCGTGYDCVIGAVAHSFYKYFNSADLKILTKAPKANTPGVVSKENEALRKSSGVLLLDLKNIWSDNHNLQNSLENIEYYKL